MWIINMGYAMGREKRLSHKQNRFLSEKFFLQLGEILRPVGGQYPFVVRNSENVPALFFPECDHYLSG